MKINICRYSANPNGIGVWISPAKETRDTLLKSIMDNAVLMNKKSFEPNNDYWNTLNLDKFLAFDATGEIETAKKDLTDVVKALYPNAIVEY